MGLTSTKCLHCGLLLNQGNLHSIEDCANRIMILLDSVYDERGVRLDHFKLLDSLSTLKERSAVIVNDLYDAPTHVDLEPQ